MNRIIKNVMSGFFLLASVVGMLFMTSNPSLADKSTYKTAIFAGGCFWCVESDFDKVEGVVDTVSGYSGGKTKNPTYKEVTYKETGHYEVVKITYDPAKVSYKKLLFYFWRSIDPTDPSGQFCDKGSSYRSAIFVANDEEKKLAIESKQEIEKSNILKAPIQTKILDAAKFYPAEDYHQNYYKKNPLNYRAYRFGCRRDARVKALWGKQAHGGIKH